LGNQNVSAPADLLRDAVTSYATFTDRYYEQSKPDAERILSRLASISAGNSESLVLPKGFVYQNFQTNQDSSAASQLREFAGNYDGLEVTFKGSENGTEHPDPTRADTGERIYELTGLTYNNVAVPFEAQHSEITTFTPHGIDKSLNLQSLAIKTSATLNATFTQGAVELTASESTKTYGTIQQPKDNEPHGENAYLFLQDMEDVLVSLTENGTSGGSVEIATSLDATITVTGTQFADSIAIEAAARTVTVHAKEGQDHIAIGHEGSLESINGDLHLFTGDNDDVITIDSSSSTDAVNLTIDTGVLQYSREESQTSRLSDVLSLQNVTDDESRAMAEDLAIAAVPYAKAAFQVNLGDLEAVRDEAAGDIVLRLQNLLTVSDDTQENQNSIDSVFVKAVEKTQNILLKADREQLQNQIKLYVRARYYEDGPDDSGEGAVSP
jgi:hypothetical protein